MRLIPIVFTVSFVILLVACGKDKFQTTPKIEVKSLSSKEIRQGEILTIRLNYFDKEGDLSKGLLTYIRVRTNKTPIPNPGANDKADTIPIQLPEVPVKNTGEISLTFDYNFLDEDPGRNDTMFFKFTVQDTEGNKSDTISTQPITAIKP